MSNADDRPPCAECGDTWGAGVHDYAHPYKAPQPAPSGDEAKVRETRALNAAVDWAKYPKLRKIFEHRPRVNVYWLELARLAEDLAIARRGSEGK